MKINTPVLRWNTEGDELRLCRVGWTCGRDGVRWQGNP